MWFLIGVAPIVALLLLGFKADPAAMVITVAALSLVLLISFSIVYGMYDMGWIMDCGPRSFWEAQDC